MRRRIAIVAIALLGAAAINVLVAWTLALTIDGFPLDPNLTRLEGASAPPPSRWDSVLVIPRHGSTVVMFSAQTVIRHRPPPLSGNATEIELREYVLAMEAYQRGDRSAPSPYIPTIDVPAWSRAAAPPRHDQYDQTRFIEDARGWPLRSLVSYGDQPMPGSAAPPGPAWRIDMLGTQGPLGLPRGLPLRPLPVGFSLNILLYAAMILAAWEVRRIWRCRRGCCPDCGYPVGASPVCTECGRALRAPTAARVS